MKYLFRQNQARSWTPIFERMAAEVQKLPTHDSLKGMLPEVIDVSPSFQATAV